MISIVEKEILDALSPYDIGQSIIVQQGMVLGIEAAEGTDGLINRSKTLARDGAGGSDKTSESRTKTKGRSPNNRNQNRAAS